MKTFTLVLQCAIFGIVAALAFPEWEWQYWVAIVINAALVVAYGKVEE